MKKLFGILLVVALVLSFNLVATTPVAAATTYYVATTGDNTNDGLTPATAWLTIQYAVTTAGPGDTIEVAAGTYAGANVDKRVAIVGAAEGASIITSGVPFSDGSSLTTGFRIFPGVDGAEIRNFTVECDDSANFFFGVFGRAADDVIVDSLIVNGPIQGITNWGGSNWEITSNELNYTEASGGGGIGILVGAYPPDFPVASGNLIEGNSIIATATAPDFSTPGILLSLDLRWGAYDLLTGSEEMFGNQILNNIVTGNGAVHSHGVQIGVLGLGADPDKIAATMGIIDDTTVQGNTISGTDFGMYFFTVCNLVARYNDMTDMNHGILIYDGSEDNTINFNSFSGIGGFGLFNDTGALVDATVNWWGHASGPGGVGPGKGAGVSDDADFMPWLMEEDGAETTETDTGSGVDAEAATDNVSGQATGGDGTTTVSVGEYVGEPTGVDPGLQVGAFFFDVHVGGTEPHTLVVTVKCPGGECSGMILKWFDGTDWLEVSPVSYTNGEVVAELNNVDSSPLISELTGTPFGLGGPPLVPAAITVGWDGTSINKAAIMAPWIALLATMLGATLLVVRRRRVQI